VSATSIKQPRENFENDVRGGQKYRKHFRINCNLHVCIHDALDLHYLAYITWPI